MKFEISQKFYFDAAHSLQRKIDTESSQRIHGHTYDAEITLTGVPEKTTGMVVDLGIIRNEIEKVRKSLDHHFLDEIDDLGPPTLENLCIFIVKKISIQKGLLRSVRVWRRGQGDSCLLTLNEH